MFVSTFLSVLVTRCFVKNQVYRQSSVHPNGFIETNVTMPRPTCEEEIHLMWNKSKTCAELVQLAMGSTYFWPTRSASNPALTMAAHVFGVGQTLTSSMKGLDTEASIFVMARVIMVAC